MRKTIIVTTITLLCLFLLFSLLTVFNARSHTAQLIKHAQAIQQDSLALHLEDWPELSRKTFFTVVDPTFYRHDGTEQHTDHVDGATVSITRRLSNDYFPDTYGNLLHRYRQNLIARYAIDPQIDKNTQAELFINHVYMGESNKQELRGLAAAANFYFKKDFYDLSQAEFLRLIAMIAEPHNFNIFEYPEKNQKRANDLLHFLNQQGINDTIAQEDK